MSRHNRQGSAAFQDWTDTQKVAAMGVGASLVAAVVVGYFASERLRQGVKVSVALDQPTRNLITQTTTDLTSKGIPLRVTAGRRN